MTLETLTTFFGWMAVLNLGFLTTATLMLFLLKDRIVAIHAGMFSTEEQVVRNTYFNWLAHYKTLTLVFTLMPYLALKLT